MCFDFASREFPHNTQRLPQGLATAVTGPSFNIAGVGRRQSGHVDDLLGDD